MEPIREGMTGTAVEDVQERLASLGYEIAVEERGGAAFGQSTANAVARFRLEHNLSLTPEVDVACWSALVDECYQMGDRTLYKGTWFFGILTAIAGGFININVLFELVNIGTLSAFIIVSAGILWMRKTQPDAHRGFRAPGVPFTPICAIIFCFILICGLNWETWVRFAIWFALGLIVYFVYSRKHSALNKPGLF